MCGVTVLWTQSPRRHAAQVRTCLWVALVMSSVMSAGGALAGCSEPAADDGTSNACLNDAPGQPVCCSVGGSCAQGFVYAEGGNKCGNRYVGSGGGNYRSTCCVPSAAGEGGVQSTPAATSTTPAPSSATAGGIYSCGNDVCPDNNGGLWAKVLGRSGKIVLAPTPNVASDPNRIRLQISGLRELDSSGSQLGAGGNCKHSFASFATQEFSFGAVRDSTYKGVRCVLVPFNATLCAGSTLAVEVFLFKEAASLTVGPDIWSVTNR